MIEVKKLRCIFPDAPGRGVEGLRLPYFKMEEGETWAVIGPSGSGKTTLLHCLSALLSPTKGTIFIHGRFMNTMTEKEKTHWRATEVGYIFQKSLLIPHLTVSENIRLGADMAGRNVPKREVDRWLSKVGLEGYGDRHPAYLSGGERQRVAFLRAIMKEPTLILADELTASLDKENSDILMNLLLNYQRRTGCMLLCATHDPAVQQRFTKVLPLMKGGTKCT